MPTTLSSDTEQLIKRAKRLVGVADTWRESTEKVLYWARCSVNDPGGSQYNDRALALVDRCFKVKTHKTKDRIKRDLDFIKKCFRRIAWFFDEVKADKGFLSVGPPVRPNDIAYAQVDGWRKGDKDGLVFVLAQCKGRKDENLTDIIMHESVHFAAGVGHYEINGEPAYGQKVFGLTNAQALKNASSYAYLAYLARLPHTQWLTAT